MRLTPVLPALALLVAACGPSYSSGGASTTPSPSAAVDMASMPHWSANLSALNGSTVHGSATVHSMNGSQTVNIQVSGGTPGATYPWHIHSGTCAETNAPIVGNMQMYTALGTSGDGTASMMTTVPVTLNSDQRYHINVHASPTNMGTYVACGDLTR